MWERRTYIDDKDDDDDDVDDDDDDGDIKHDLEVLIGEHWLDRWNDL